MTLQNTVYKTVEGPSVRPSVSSFDRSSGGFAAERRAGRRYRDQQRRPPGAAAAWRSAANASRVALIAEAEQRTVILINHHDAVLTGSLCPVRSFSVDLASHKCTVLDSSIAACTF